MVPITGLWAPSPAARVKERHPFTLSGPVHGEPLALTANFLEANVRVQAGLKAVSMPTPLLQPGLMETTEL